MSRVIEDVRAWRAGPTRLKVLHAGKFYPPVRGGMETVLGHLCTGTAARWDVRALVANGVGRTHRESRGGVEVIRVGSAGRIASVPLATTLPLHLWKDRLDCLVLHEPNPVAAAALALHTPARHLVIWHHSDLIRPRWAPLAYRVLQRRLYRRAASVIVSSPRLAEHSPVVRQARRVAVIPFGISLEQYLDADPPASRRAEVVRARYPGPVVLFVGRLVYYKGVDVLLLAMTRCPGTLLIVGEGPMARSWRKLADELGIASRVRFLGRLSGDDLVDHYRAADLFVLPSTRRTEAFGVVQVEAMASGLPVVSTDLPTGVPWVNQDGVTGLVVPPGDPGPLAEAMTRLMENPALRATMGEAGRRRAVEQFSKERMVRDFVELIETVAGG